MIATIFQGLLKIPTIFQGLLKIPTIFQGLSKLTTPLRLFLMILFMACLAACQSYNDPSRRTPGEVTDDSAIYTAIKAKLIADPDIQGLSINVDVYQGAVTLSGRIPSEVLRNRALKIATEIKGVVKVHDSLALITE